VCACTPIHHEQTVREEVIDNSTVPNKLLQVHLQGRHRVERHPVRADTVSGEPIPPQQGSAPQILPAWSSTRVVNPRFLN
jgi:hypothetical protein